MAATGWTNRRIAQDLFVTLKTVETHLSNVYRKLNVSGREHLATLLSDPEGRMLKATKFV